MIKLPAINKIIFEAFNENSVGKFEFHDYGEDGSDRYSEEWGYVSEVYSDGSGDKVLRIPNYFNNLNPLIEDLLKVEITLSINNKNITISDKENTYSSRFNKKISLCLNQIICVLNYMYDKDCGVKMISDELDKEIVLYTKKKVKSSAISRAWISNHLSALKTLKKLLN